MTMLLLMMERRHFAIAVSPSGTVPSVRRVLTGHVCFNVASGVGGLYGGMVCNRDGESASGRVLARCLGSGGNRRFDRPGAGGRVL